MKSAQQLPDNPSPIARVVCRSWTLVRQLNTIADRSECSVDPNQSVMMKVSFLSYSFFLQNSKYGMSGQYLQKQQLGWALSICHSGSLDERSVSVKATAWMSAQYLPKQKIGWAISICQSSSLDERSASVKATSWMSAQYQPKGVPVGTNAKQTFGIFWLTEVLYRSATSKMNRRGFEVK